VTNNCRTSEAWKIPAKARLREYAVYWVRRWQNRENKPTSRIESENSSDRKRVLLIEDRVPHKTLGAGFPRSCAMVEALLELGWKVTFYQTAFTREPPEHVSYWQGRGVEVVLHQGIPGLRRFLRRCGHSYKVIIVSRPNNMASAKSVLRRLQRLSGPRILYDAEALFSAREIQRGRLHGMQLSAHEEKQIKKAELDLAVGADAILTVSQLEEEQFRLHRSLEHGPVFVLPHVTHVNSNSPPFERRAGFLFVGAVHDEFSPNADAIRWFLAEIFPKIRMTEDAGIEIVGAHRSGISFNGAGVRHVGQVANLQSFYDCARVFVAPTRFAAGIPLKVYEAASAGLPVVSTSILAEQLGWIDEAELLVADGAEDFAKACVRLYRDAGLWKRLQTNALAKVKSVCSKESFKATLQNALSVGHGHE
jgi:hypothetical protein